MGQRSNSSIIKLRLFHNWIKMQLYADVIDKLDARDIKLLELAVGRAGDLYKWATLGVSSMVGFDIDDESINGKNGAYHRYRKLQIKKNKGHIDNIPKCEFFVMDLSKEGNLAKIYSKIGGRKFNLISCQFAIHYFFKDESSLDTLMNIIDYSTESGGYFIGTTIDGRVLNKMFMSGNVIDTDKFRIENRTITRDSDSPYGNKYVASLGEKGEDHYFRDNDSVEYMVDIDELKYIAGKYNLEFIGKFTFEEWYEKYKPERDNEMSESEKQFSFLNFSFVFRKK
jgi:mRNA (guanine-N7-)-methyltransferase